MSEWKTGKPLKSSRLLQRWRAEKNPVTRSVLADIIGDRIDMSVMSERSVISVMTEMK